MSNSKPEAGSVTWMDLTVPEAKEIRDFYSKVTGWIPEPVSMGEYDDYNMTLPESKKPAAGICHARGANSNLPPQWLIYITVNNIDESIKQCKALGGKIISELRYFGNSRYCVIQDPAGACSALFEQGEEAK